MFFITFKVLFCISLLISIENSGLITDKKCQGSEEFLEERLKGIEKSWTELIEACHLKTKKLMEANEQQKFQYSMQDLEFWLGEVSLNFLFFLQREIMFKRLFCLSAPFSTKI